MTAINGVLKIIRDYRASIGEGPMWSPRDNALYWLDTVRSKIIRYRPDDRQSEVRELGYRPSCVILLADGRLLVAFKKGLALFDFASGETKALELHDMSFEHEIFNDGACDRAGRLWIGTMDRKAASPVGSLYRFTGDFRAERMSSAFTVSNGIAWSPDGKTMYHADSRPGRIHAYDFDVEAGSVSNQRVFLDYEGKGRRPDGCTVDAEGHLWVAEIDGSRVARYAPDGKLAGEIMLPVRKPTSVMFGGKDYATLFITSMSYGLTEDALATTQASAGLLLAIEVGVRGLPEPTFRLPLAPIPLSDSARGEAGA